MAKAKKIKIPKIKGGVRKFGAVVPERLANWGEIAPRRVGVRRQLPPQCFIDPKNLKYPICTPDGEISPAGILAAIKRARINASSSRLSKKQHRKHKRILNKAVSIALALAPKMYKDPEARKEFIQRVLAAAGKAPTAKKSRKRRKGRKRKR